MTEIKFCGLSRPEDIEYANRLKPQYIGFVFAKKSKRYVTPEKAKELKALLDPGIKAVGVFVNEDEEAIAGLCSEGVIDMIQLHGSEGSEEIETLRTLTDCPLIQAFQIKGEEDLKKAEESTADLILLDSGAGTGTVLDWEALRSFPRPFLLAGGLNPANVAEAISVCHPFAVDVSSGIESAGYKDFEKMKAFREAVRGGAAG